MATVGQALTAPEAGWQRFEDSSNRLIYSGTWTAETSVTGDSSGNLHYSNALNSSCTFTFYGTEIRIIGTYASNYSTKTNIVIDGVTYTYNQYATSVLRSVLVFDKEGLSLEQHTVSIINKDSGNYISVDAIDIDSTGYLVAVIGQALTAPDPGWQRFDDADTNISYIGTWLTSSSVVFYDGSMHYSGTSGALVHVNFYGTMFRVMGAIYSGYTSSIDIYIDGIKVGNFSQLGATTVYQSLNFSITGLVIGNHHVEIIPNNLSSSVDFQLDSLDIDATGYLSPYNPFVPKLPSTSLLSMNTGDYIPCTYNASSNTFGVLSGLGIATGTLLPTKAITAPNGYFNWIMVGYDTAGRKKFIADRNIQSAITWDSLNTSGLCSATGIPITIDVNSTNYSIRLMSGGISDVALADINNEWDQIIVNGPVHASDDNYWNFSSSYSWTTTTNITTASTNRTVRGLTTVTHINDYVSSTTASTIGFRPELLVYVPAYIDDTSISGSCRIINQSHITNTRYSVRTLSKEFTNNYSSKRNVNPIPNVQSSVKRVIDFNEILYSGTSRKSMYEAKIYSDTYRLMGYQVLRNLSGVFRNTYKSVIYNSDLNRTVTKFNSFNNGISRLVVPLANILSNSYRKTYQGKNIIHNAERLVQHTITIKDGLERKKSKDILLLNDIKRRIYLPGLLLSNLSRNMYKSSTDKSVTYRNVTGYYHPKIYCATSRRILSGQLVDSNLLKRIYLPDLSTSKTKRSIYVVGQAESNLYRNVTGYYHPKIYGASIRFVSKNIITNDNVKRIMYIPESFKAITSRSKYVLSPVKSESYRNVTGYYHPKIFVGLNRRAYKQINTNSNLRRLMFIPETVQTNTMRQFSSTVQIPGILYRAVSSLITYESLTNRTLAKDLIMYADTRSLVSNIMTSFHDTRRSFSGVTKTKSGTSRGVAGYYHSKSYSPLCRQILIDDADTSYTERLVSGIINSYSNTLREVDFIPFSDILGIDLEIARRVNNKLNIQSNVAIDLQLATRIKFLVNRRR